MNPLKKLKALLAVLHAGRALADPIRWKETQLWASLLIALFGLLDAFGVGFALSEDAIAGAVVAVSGLANAYLTVATTKKIGLPETSPSGDR